MAHKTNQGNKTLGTPLSLWPPPESGSEKTYQSLKSATSDLTHECLGITLLLKRHTQKHFQNFLRFYLKILVSRTYKTFLLWSCASFWACAVQPRPGPTRSLVCRAVGRRAKGSHTPSNGKAIVRWLSSCEHEREGGERKWEWEKERGEMERRMKKWTEGEKKRKWDKSSLGGLVG